MIAKKYDLDTGDPNQNLANAIVLQAVSDWRSLAKWLAAHPETPELVDTAKHDLIRRERILRKWTQSRQKDKYFGWSELARHKNKAECWQDVKVPKTATERVKSKIGYTEAEIMLAKIRMKKDQLKDEEEWFYSTDYELLTDLDPDYLLSELRKEAEGYAKGSVSAVASDPEETESG